MRACRRTPTECILLNRTPLLTLQASARNVQIEVDCVLSVMEVLRYSGQTSLTIEELADHRQLPDELRMVSGPERTSYAMLLKV